MSSGSSSLQLPGQAHQLPLPQLTLAEGDAASVVSSSGSGPARRPGPKLATQPASTQRRQKNREAQRAHRERKEQYLKELEFEVVRLRQYGQNLARERTAAIRERDVTAQENRRLRRLVEQLNALPGAGAISGEPSPYSDWAGIALSPISSSSNQTVITNSSCSVTGPSSSFNSSFTTDVASEGSATQADRGFIDHDAIALDFVLSLEGPCLHHIRYLVGRANNPTGLAIQKPEEVPDDGINEHISGHALMASCPPPSHVVFNPTNDCPYQPPSTLPKATLAELLGLYEKLPELGQAEIPPIKAWVKLRQDERFLRLDTVDFQLLADQLLPTIKCHRFGAVLRTSELDAAIENVCARHEPIQASISQWSD